MGRTDGIDDLPTLAAVHLGDVVTFPDRTSLTVRARVVLPNPVGQMAGFVVCGELERLVGFPPLAGHPYVQYHRVGRTPPAGIKARAVYSGVANYWAPHLPAARSAMGEVTWRVAEVAGSLDPLVVVFRSGEPAVFMRDGDLDEGDLDVKWMPRDRPDERIFRRQSSTVGTSVPDHAGELEPAFERVPGAGR
jgi:hypothetical protein